MRIGIDIDEVVFEFMDKFLEDFNKENNTSFKRGDVFSYNLWETLNLKKEEAYKAVYDFYEKPVFNELDLCEGVKEAIQELSKNHEIIFLTSRPLFIKEITLKHLKDNFENLSFEVLFSGELSIKEGEKRTKGEICFEKNISIMIEDNHTYAKDCADKCVQTFLLEKPWNKNSEEHENIIKVKNWGEILEKLK